MATLTCRTEGCFNQDKPLEYDLTYRDEQNRVQQTADVECGVCHEPITDIVR